jgi:hypothetical protein
MSKLSEARYCLAVRKIELPPRNAVRNVECALCGQTVSLDFRATFCTAPVDSAFVCDDCGDGEAPELMALVRRFRAAGDLTLR